MATVTVKNIPDKLYEQIKQSAKANHRSINSEIIVCIEHALMGRKVDPKKILSAARALRKKTAGYLLTEKEIAKARNIGRP